MKQVGNVEIPQEAFLAVLRVSLSGAGTHAAAGKLNGTDHGLALIMLLVLAVTGRDPRVRTLGHVLACGSTWRPAQPPANRRWSNTRAFFW